MFTLTLIFVSSAVLYVAHASVPPTPPTVPTPATPPTPPTAPPPEPPPINRCSNCNIWDKNLVWALEDCVCRPFQNQCLLDEENAERLRQRKTPLVPVSKLLCKAFIPRTCPPTRSTVAAEFPLPSDCGCNGKPGSIVIKPFSNFCLLQKTSAENDTPYLAFSKWNTKLC